MSNAPSHAGWPRRAAIAGLMLAPLLLSACYVVPVAPAPVYRPYYRHHHHPHPSPYPSPYYRPGWYGQAAPEGSQAQVHIEVAKSAR